MEILHTSRIQAPPLPLVSIPHVPFLAPLPPVSLPACLLTATLAGKSPDPASKARPTDQRRLVNTEVLLWMLLEGLVKVLSVSCTTVRIYRKVRTVQSSNFTENNQNLQEEIQGDQITGLWLLIVLALLSADVVMIMLYSGSSNLKP